MSWNRSHESDEIANVRSVAATVLVCGLVLLVPLALAPFVGVAHIWEFDQRVGHSAAALLAVLAVSLVLFRPSARGVYGALASYALSVSAATWFAVDFALEGLV